MKSRLKNAGWVRRPAEEGQMLPVPSGKRTARTAPSLVTPRTCKPPPRIMQADTSGTGAVSWPNDLAWGSRLASRAPTPSPRRRGSLARLFSVWSPAYPRRKHSTSPPRTLDSWFWSRKKTLLRPRLQSKLPGHGSRFAWTRHRATVCRRVERRKTREIQDQTDEKPRT